MFRWDKWFEGLGISIVAGVFASLGPFLSDGSISKGEWWSLLILALGITGAWCKNHPPETWDGTERRGMSNPEQK